eukprot:SAG31_NODE_795_length_12036_cov_28.879953_4_plen_443_part_00
MRTELEWTAPRGRSPAQWQRGFEAADGPEAALWTEDRGVNGDGDGGAAVRMPHRHAAPPQGCYRRRLATVGAGLRQLASGQRPQATTSKCECSGAAAAGGVPLTAAASSPGPLSGEDLATWERDGVVVLRNAVPPALLDHAAAEIWAFLGISDPADRGGWYRAPRDPGTGELRYAAERGDAYGFTAQVTTQAQWDVRQSPRVHAAFAQLWGTRALRTGSGRMHFKPPTQELGAASPLAQWHEASHEVLEPGGALPIHFDLTPAELRAGIVTQRTQAVLYLRDTVAQAGAFRCVKGFHRRFEEWAASYGGDAGWPTAQGGAGALNHPLPSSIVPAFGEFSDVGGAAGDLLIWHSYVPHGTAPNATHDNVRLAMYVSMQPNPAAGDPSVRDLVEQGWYETDAVREWAEPAPLPSWDAAAGAVAVQTKPATLTKLGRQLLGIEAW